MARQREFDEGVVLDAAVQCFWKQGYASTSVKDLVEGTRISSASLYNAYGDKRTIFQTALTHYVEKTLEERIRRCETLPPQSAIKAFLGEILKNSLNDRQHKGCLVVNSALELAPHDPELRKVIVKVLRRLEAFFLTCIEKGQADETITRLQPARTMAQHLLSVVMGMRVLARVRPERLLLEGVVEAALVSLVPR